MSGLSPDQGGQVAQPDQVCLRGLYVLEHGPFNPVPAVRKPG